MGKDQSNFAISRWVSLGFYTIVVHKEYHNFFHFIGNRDRLGYPLYAYPLVRLGRSFLTSWAHQQNLIQADQRVRVEGVFQTIPIPNKMEKIIIFFMHNKCTEA